MFKNRKLNAFIIVIITFIVLFLLLKDNFLGVLNALNSANYLFIFIAFVMIFLYIFFDVLNFKTITDMYTKKISLSYQIYIGIIYRFLSGITPLATGGQPFQVYELHKKGVSYTQGTNIAINSYLIFQIAAIIFGTFAIIMNQIFDLFRYVPVLAQLTLIGFIINFAILLLLILVSFSKKFNYKLVNFFIKILYKLKIVKDIDNKKEKWNNICDRFYDNSHTLFKHKDVLIKGVIFELISLTFFYSLPFVLSFAFNIGGSFTLFESLTASSYVFMSGCFIPIPGASGGMEFAFMGFFSNFIAGSSLNALLIMWRFISYYAPVIVGGIVFNLKYSVSNKKAVS